MMRATIIIATALGLALSPLGCKEDNSDSDCVPEIVTGDLADGEFCQEMVECQSGFCLSFGHTPVDPDGVCADRLEEIGAVHVTGNVTDFYSLAPVPNVVVKFSGALEVLQKSMDFEVLDTTTADGDGLVDCVVPADAAGQADVGLVVILEEDGYYPTGTGLVEPEIGCNMYPPGIRNRDMKLASIDLIDEWSSLILADYPQLENRLPLGDKAGVIGAIRYTSDGAGVAGVHLVSRTEDSNAKVLYLNEDEDAFVEDVTSSNGFFAVLGPGVAEKFDAANASGDIVSRREATMGETNGVMFSTTVHVDDL